MAEALEVSSTEDGLPAEWKPSSRRSRKSGCSNIFSGVNLHQLHRLFRTAGDRNAEHRAKLVWQDVEANPEGAEEGKQTEEEQVEDEVDLAQALVGLRVRARNKTGIRAEGHSKHKWLRTAGYLRVEEPLAVYSVEGNADQSESLETFKLPAEEDITGNQNPVKPTSWRLGIRMESARDSERYLHRILH
ncbi:uncharacterized protein avpi1 [Gambusia affinis]|uniref:uncharacterized protein avpi1 n=1 Tax=Gambusia affinis TaxID=33528 RepID=UPI001CDCF32E|nr:uncharacterized protein avpi1 [Gambusia affinis]